MSRPPNYNPFLYKTSGKTSFLPQPPSNHLPPSTTPENSLTAPCTGFRLKPKPTEYDLTQALKASAAFRPLNYGKQIHPLVIKLGFCRFTVLMTALMDLSLKCRSLADARRLFDEMPERDVVSWSSMIVGYARHGHFEESLFLLQRMNLTGSIPNGYSFSGALSSCTGLCALKQGRQIHAQLHTLGILGVNQILHNSLLGMYSKCQSLGLARKLFDLMPTKDAITWNEMISGYLHSEQGEGALKLMASMVSTGVKPDKFTYAICADACAGLASERQGTQIHTCIVKSGFQSDLVIGNALIDMYAKCGSINSAKLVFDLMPFRDAILWTAMLSALGKCGCVEEVIERFEEMCELNVEPDEITYLAVLSACSHGGLIDQGWHYFRTMTEDDSIPAKPEHYACMVDLLCRGGYLLEALEIIKQMPVRVTVSVWSAFLNSSRLYGNIELTQFAAAQLLELDPENHSNLVVLSNMYAAESDWNETNRIREGMKIANMKKEPGCSWVEAQDGIHVFVTASRSRS